MSTIDPEIDQYLPEPYRRLKAVVVDAHPYYDAHAKLAAHAAQLLLHGEIAEAQVVATLALALRPVTYSHCEHCCDDGDHP